MKGRNVTTKEEEDRNWLLEAVLIKVLFVIKHIDVYFVPIITRCNVIGVKSGTREFIIIEEGLRVSNSSVVAIL